MPAVLDRLRNQHNAAQERYRAIEALVQQEDRDPSDVEQGELNALAETMRSLEPRITEATNLERSLATSNAALATIPVGTPGAPTARPPVPQAPAERFRSWGDFAIASARGDIAPDDRDAVLNASLDYMIEHARALVDVTSADVPGLMPPTWIRTIADTISTAMPFASAFSQMPLPNVGMTLTYPKIATRPLVGKQTAEKTDVPSRKTTVTSGNAPVVTYGGGEDVSVQVLERTDPAYLTLMLELYAEQMAIATNTDAIAAAEAAMTMTQALGATAELWAAGMAAAVGQVLTASRLVPDTLVVSTAMWQAFAGAADATGRPLFPNAAPSNPVGSTSLDSTGGSFRGLNMAVDPMLSGNVGILGVRTAFTSLLGPVQTLTADNVSKLGRDYAVYRFAAFITRRPDALIKLTIP